MILFFLINSRFPTELLDGGHALPHAESFNELNLVQIVSGDF